MAIAISWLCTLNEGIHARPAGYIARLCNAFQADIVWENTRTGQTGNAKSALSLIASDSLFNDPCRITLSGADEYEAASQLRQLLETLPSFTLEPAPDTSNLEGYLPRCLRELMPQVMQGTCIHPGAAIGLPIDMQRLTFADLCSRNPHDGGNMESEKTRFIMGVDTLRREKEAALEQIQGIGHALMEAQLLMIADNIFQDNVIACINDTTNTWSAILQASVDFCSVLERSSSHYIQERTLDVLDIATQLLTAVYGTQALPSPLVLSEPSIVFAHALTPGQLLALDKTHLAGLVLTSTGKTSHTAILARALNIPAIADIDIPRHRENHVIIDAGPGILIPSPDNRILRYYRQEITLRKAHRVEHAVPQSLLSPEMILWQLDAQDKNEVLKLMVDHLWCHQRTDDRDGLCDALWARELPFPTVVGSGFAIPHARTDVIHDSTISVATLRQPVIWGGVQVDTIFMLTISASAAANEHMKYFSTLARMLMNDDFVTHAKSADTPEALYNLLCKTLAF